MHTWVIGAGGLLGSALRRSVDDGFASSPIPWHESHGSSNALAHSLATFRTAARTEPWSIIWAAGYATTATPPGEADRELQVFERFITELRERPPAGPGSFAFVSSAGAMYAGSVDPPFTSTTTASPIGAYGQLKFAQEGVVRTLGSRGIDATIVRVSNLYGPGQNLNKLQGIVSSLCWSAITKREVNIFVPLDTLRDYIYVDDAAARILHWAQSREKAHADDPIIKVVASGRPISLGQVINTVEDVLHMRIPVSFGVHTAAAYQARDVRLIPDTDAAIDSLPLTPFPAGVRRVFEDLLSRRQAQHRLTIESR